MHAIIIDATGSISEEQLDAGTAYYCDILNKECPWNDRTACSVFVWTNVDRHGHRTSLQDVVKMYRSLNPDCVIHFITDGYVTEEEVSHINHIYVYEDCAESAMQHLKRRVSALVPVPYNEQPPVTDQEREHIAAQVDEIDQYLRGVVKAPHEEAPTLLDPMKEIRELAEKAMAMVTDEVKYKEHKERIYNLFPQLRELEQQFAEFDKRMKADHDKWAEEHPAQAACDHGVSFDYEAAKNLDSFQVRKRWPRLMGPCPKGCGFNGIGYASYSHYICGDW